MAAGYHGWAIDAHPFLADSWPTKEQTWDWRVLATCARCGATDRVGHLCHPEGTAETDIHRWRRLPKTGPTWRERWREVRWERCERCGQVRIPPVDTGGGD